MLENMLKTKLRYCHPPSNSYIFTQKNDQRNKTIYHFVYTAAAAAKLLQSFPILCGPIDGSPPGSPVPGILQERTLEWVAISFSSAWKWKVKVKWLSCVRLLATPWTSAYQAPISKWFARQEYWSEFPLCTLHPHNQCQPLFNLLLQKANFWMGLAQRTCNIK